MRRTVLATRAMSGGRSCAESLGELNRRASLIRPMPTRPPNAGEPMIRGSVIGGHVEQRRASNPEATPQCNAASEEPADRMSVVGVQCYQDRIVVDASGAEGGVAQDLSARLGHRSVCVHSAAVNAHHCFRLYSSIID